MKNESLLEKIRHASVPIETPPKGFKTTQQWADEWGMSFAHAQRFIRDGVKLKLLVKRDYRINSGGSRRKIPHYCES